jgi:hypothetical protein
LVAFNDSYADESRLNYVGTHNRSASSAETFLPESFSTAGGGGIWPRYVIQYKGGRGGKWKPSMTLYGYAASGAVCSNLIAPRYIVQKKPEIVTVHKRPPDRTFSGISRPFIYTFLSLQTKMADRNRTTEAYSTPPLTGTDTVYAMWLGMQLGLVPCISGCD